MATDIGVRIGLDGAADFRRELKLITQQSKELDSEMKALTSSFEANDKSQSSLKAQSEVLGRQIDTQKKKIELLSSQYDKANTELGRLAAELQDATQSYGQNSTEAQRALKAYQNQSIEVSRLQENINKANTALNKMQQSQSRLSSELNDNRSAFDRLNDMASEHEDELNRLKRQYSDYVLEQKEATEEAKDLARQIDKLSSELSQNRQDLKRAATAADELDNSLDDVEDAADDAGRGMSSFSDIIGGNVIADGISGIVSGIKDLHESSIEYRTIMASLENSSERAGYTAEQTEESYKKLVGVLGDTQTAATTTANLQAIGLEQGKLQDMINGVIGAWATYGDSIPIDSLAESVTETIKAGTVTGTFADVLNWANGNEDEFNELLASANDKTERANIVLKELAKQGLVQAGEGWQEMNESLVEYNQAQDDLDAALADLSKSAEPVLTGLSKGLTGILNGFNWLGSQLVGFFNGTLDETEEKFKSLTEEQRYAAVEIVNQQDLLEGSIEYYAALDEAIDQVTGKHDLEQASIDRSNLGLVELGNTTQYYLDTLLKEIDTLDQTDQKYAEAVTATTELTTAHQESSARINEALAQVEADMASLRETYQLTKESAKNSLDSQYSMFSELNTQVETSVATVSENLMAQQTFFEDYATNLQNAIDRGVSDGLLQKLSDGSVESAAILAEMNTMTQPEIDAFVAQFDKTDVAKEKVAGLTASIATDYDNMMNELRAKSESLNAEMIENNSLYTTGVDYIKGFIQGANDTLGDVEDVCLQMGELANDTTADAVGTHSPSTITKGYGRDYVLGFKEGVLTNQITAVNTAANMGKLSVAALKNNISYSDIYSTGLNIAYGLGDGIYAGDSYAINAAASMARNALAAARRELDINSPSKAFEEIGELSDKGFAIGLDNGEAIKQMEQSISAMLTQAATLMQAQSGYAPIENAIRSIPAGNTDVQIVVNAADSQSANEIAEIVMYKIQSSVNQRKAVWG